MTPGPLRRFLGSSVGSKVIVGLTGLLLFGFLVAHLAGNLLLLVDPRAFNAYGQAMSTNPLLVPAELALLAIFLLHAGKAVLLTLANRRARPERYERKERAGGRSRKTLASSTMVFSGLAIAIFLPIHLNNFKWGSMHLVPGTQVRDLFRTVLEHYRNPLWVAFYVAAMALLGLHLKHGFSSAFQSLGIEHSRWTRSLVRLGVVLAALIAGGFALIPIVLFLTQGGAS